jgi:hypothetical protein
VVKTTPRELVEDLRHVYEDVRTAQHVRQVCDTVPERAMLVLQHMPQNLLELIPHEIPALLTKSILYDALKGIAELHVKDSVHTGRYDGYTIAE